MDDTRLRAALVDELRSRGCIRSPAVAAAFAAVPRARFVSDHTAREGVASAYQDEVIPLRRDAAGALISSCSQPAIVAEMLEQLDVVPGQRVLEVGTGSGWNAALLDRLAAPGGRVVSVELEPELAARAREALSGNGHRVEVVCGDGRRGWPAGAPYDRIVSTASLDEVPRAWAEQLAPGGLLELPLRLSAALSLQAIPALRKRGGTLESEALVYGGFMWLRGAAGERAPAGGCALQAGELADGHTESWIEVRGEAVDRLGPAARRRLLAALLGEPRLQPLDDRAAAPAAALFVALHGIDGDALGVRRNELDAEPGLVAPGGAATLVRDGDRACYAAGYGDEPPVARLAEVIAEWDALGAPAVEDLRITIAYDDADLPARSWRRTRRGDCRIALDWGSPR